MSHNGVGSHLQRMLDAKRDANSARSTSLILIADGMATMWDIIDEAARPGRHALLKIRLVHLLAAQPDWGRSRAVDTAAAFAHACGLDNIDRRGLLALDIGWLLYHLTRARLWALADATVLRTQVTDDVDEPWPGFPHTSMPDELEVMHEALEESQV